MRLKLSTALMLLLAVGCSSSAGGPLGSGGGGAAGQAGSGIVTGGADGSVAGGGGSAAGSGGAGGAPAGTGGVVNKCLPAMGVYPRFWLSPDRQPTTVAEQVAYDGPAVVERSADNQLILAFEPGSAGSGGGGAGGAVGVATRRVYISGGDRSVSAFRPGARVWLSKAPDPSYHIGSALPPFAFAVRERQGGTLLFGMSRDIHGGESSPVSFSAGDVSCSAVGVESCWPSATVTYGSALVNGDAPVLIENGAPGVVSLGGAIYDVRVSATTTMGPPPTKVYCYDYAPQNGIRLDVEARELDALAAALEVGAQPACGHGNDPRRGIYVGFSNLAVQGAFDGPVIYKGRNSTDPDEYEFDLPGIKPSAGAPAPTMQLADGENLFPEPAVGQQFWYTQLSTGIAEVLRETEEGPIVVVGHSGSAQADGAAQLAGLLGVTVTLEKACAYTATRDLWDVVFGTSPPTRVKSGTTGALTIAGRNYRVWFWGEASFNITIYPAG